MEKAEQFIAENCPGAKAYGSYQELLTDASIQAVYIPVPTTLKTDLALEAISAKKHILIEKPLINVTDTQKNDRRVQVAGCPIYGQHDVCSQCPTACHAKNLG